MKTWNHVWVDEITGLDCMIHRAPLGNLCGYVAVPPGHPCHSLDIHETHRVVDVCVHGGLTYAAACQDTGDDSHGICHTPEPGRPRDVWWLGFDCAHHGDATPGLDHTLASLGYGDLGSRGEYRTFDYVLRQTVQLAHQLAEVQPWRLAVAPADEFWERQ